MFLFDHGILCINRYFNYSIRSQSELIEIIEYFPLSGYFNFIVMAHILR